jgi:DNA processing protein
LKDDLALALSTLFHDSPRRARQYYDLFASVEELTEHRGLLLSQIDGSYKPLVEHRWTRLNLNDRRDQLANLGIQLCYLHSTQYPVLLKEVEDAPPVFYYKGNPALFSQDMMAIVGTREMTEYGQRATAELTTALLPYFCIVSGMAKGIDTVAHTTALAQNGATIAILGTGIDQIYPRENEGLSRRIADGGVILSEYPPGTDGKAFRFPQRNRLISGVSRGVIVVEAHQKSGALNTASHAISQNRDLFAVPGSIFSPQSDGPNQLIKQGAICVTQTSDVISEYNQLPILKRALPPVSLPESPTIDISRFTDDERLLWEGLSDIPISLDQLAETIDLPMYRLLPSLTLFELKGWIIQHAGKRYSKR